MPLAMDKYAAMEYRLRAIKIKLARLKFCAAVLLTRQMAQIKIDEKEFVE